MDSAEFLAASSPRHCESARPPGLGVLIIDRRGRGGTQGDRRLFDLPPLRAFAPSAVTFLSQSEIHGEPNHSGTWIVALMCLRFATIVNDISTSSVHALHLLTCTLAHAPT